MSAVVRYGPRPVESLENPEVAATSVDVWAHTLVGTYLTDPEVIAAVLPPPLEPGDEPLVKVTVATVEIPGYPTFGAGSVSVRARHEDTQGYYALLMPMSSEQAVIGGRETFGEPKKLGTVTLVVTGEQVLGTMARMGITIVEMSGTAAEKPTAPVPDEEVRTDFYFKFLPAADGRGFDHDPLLVYCHRTERTRTRQRVNGTIALGESRFDPVADLPVRSAPAITLSECASTQRGVPHGTVPADMLLPYAHQRYDDLRG